MLGDNQLFRVTGEPRELEKTSDFAVRLSGWHDAFTRSDKRLLPAWQVTRSGLYCLGRGTIPGEMPAEPAAGWTNFPFNYDPKIIALIIEQWLGTEDRTANITQSGLSGHKGFICRSMPDLADDDANAGLVLYSGDIREPSVCIVAFQPYVMHYSK